MTSEFELGYIVALLEGEGCFALDKGSPLITIQMMDSDTVSKAALIMDVIGRIRMVEARGLGREVTYKFSIYGREAIKWMRIVLPYMSNRRSTKINEIINTVISNKPYYELGEDYCKKGHSIKHAWEYYINYNTGTRQCSRCAGRRIHADIPSNLDPNYVFTNPFEKNEVRN